LSIFSLDASFKLDEDKMNEYFNSNYGDISTLSYSALSYNSTFDEMMFLYKYTTSVMTRCKSILDYLGFFNNRENVQEFVDIFAAITASTINFYNKNNNNLTGAIQLFINQVLKFNYEKTEFAVMGVELEYSPGIYRYKFIVEPITISDSEKLDDERADETAKNIINIFSFFESEFRHISISILKTTNWTLHQDTIPEIVDDNSLPGLFEQYPMMYKMIFSKRHEVLQKMGIPSVDVSENIKFDEEVEMASTQFMAEEFDKKSDKESNEEFDIWNDYVNQNSEDNFIKTLDNDEEDERFDIYEDQELEFTKIVNMIYGKICGSIRPKNINFYDINPNHISDIPVYKETLNRINEDTFDSWTIQYLCSKEYEGGEELSLNVCKIAPDSFYSCESKCNNVDKKNIDETPLLEYHVAEDELKTKKFGSFNYTKFISDNHPIEDVTEVNAFRQYINDMMKLVIKKFENYNEEHIKKICLAYNNQKENFTFCSLIKDEFNPDLIYVIVKFDDMKLVFCLNKDTVDEIYYRESN